MNIVICGAGAIGQLYGGYFAAAGHQVSLLNSQGPMTSQAFVLQTTDDMTQHWQSAELAATADVILVTTKAYQVIDAVTQLSSKGLLNDKCALVLLHNGMGPAEQLKLPRHIDLVLASSRHGALRVDNNRVKHTGVGQTDLGFANGSTYPDQQQQLTELFTLLPGSCHWHQDINQPLWHKLLINCVINPLTARDQVRNGELLGNQYQDELQQLCSEACRVASAAGLAITAEQLLGQVQQVASATANNRSSMMQDVAHQRRSEIDYINGYLVAQAHRYQLPCSAHSALLDQIRQMTPN